MLAQAGLLVLLALFSNSVIAEEQWPKPESEQLPWLVLLQYRAKSSDQPSNCGGVIINARYVLTAAHCIGHGQPASITAYIGRWDVKRSVSEVRVEEVVVHPQYDSLSESAYHDIALVRLNVDYKFNDNAKPIGLPLPPETPAADARAWIARFSRTQPNQFLQTDVPLVPNSECQASYSSGNVAIINNQICITGPPLKHSCGGDSGGPLMVKVWDDLWLVHGISTEIDCESNTKPVVYTRVAPYVDWINSNMRLQ